MKSKPILILFANLKGNLGDFAILHAMLVETEKRYPGCEKHVMSHGQLSIDQDRLVAFRGQPHPAFIYKGKTPFKRIPKMLSMIKGFGFEQWLSGKLIDYLSNEYAGKHPAAEAGDYEAVFIAGGEQWSGFSNGINMFSVLHAVSRFNPNVFIFPFSVKKKLLRFYSQDRLKICFSRLSGQLITRDSNSEAILGSICSNVSKNGADCVFSLESVAANLPTLVQKDHRVVIIAVADANGSRYEDLLVAIKRLVAGGYRVRLLTTCESEDGRDMSRLSRTLGVEFLAPSTWQEVVNEFRSAELVVTNRLHCMIFAFLADVLLLPLLNREKVIGVFKDADLPHSLTHTTELTPEKVAICTKDKELIHRKMVAYMEKVRKSDLSP